MPITKLERLRFKAEMAALCMRIGGAFVSDALHWLFGGDTDRAQMNWGVTAPSRLVEYSAHHSSPESELRRELIAETVSRFGVHANMLTGPSEGSLLRMLAHLVRARRVIEIGTFTGYSALWLAEALPPDGILFTCESNPETAQIAQSFFSRSAHREKIKLLVGPALESIAKLDGPFDLAFIDALKKEYPRYWGQLAQKIRPGGLVVLDNAMHFAGPLTKAAGFDALDECNRLVAASKDFEKVLLLHRDGIMVARKLD